MEQQTKQYQFIGDLMESKMFRSKSRVEGSNARDMADFAMMNMLALYILSNEYDFAPVAQDYARRTMAYGNFNTYRAGGTDLNIALTAVKNGMANAGDKNQLQNAKLDFNDTKIKAFLNTIKAGRKLTNYLKVMTLEAQTLARACGKNSLHNLEPEDLCALTVEAAAMARVPLAGSNWIPGINEKK